MASDYAQPRKVHRSRHFPVVVGTFLIKVWCGGYFSSCRRHWSVFGSAPSPSLFNSVFLLLVVIFRSVLLLLPHLVGIKESTQPSPDRNTLEAGTVGNIAQARPSVTEESVVQWAKNDKRRLLHVVYSVGDLDKIIKFCTECLGMKVLRKRDIPEERYSTAFLGFGPEESHFTVELSHNYGVGKYDIGTCFGHFGVAVEDVAKTVSLVKAKGGKVTREPGPVNGESSVIAFIEDLDGYKFQLLEKAPTLEPLCKIMLRVGYENFSNIISKYLCLQFMIICSRSVCPGLCGYLQFSNVLVLIFFPLINTVPQT
ncbi:probable lactoylglutathione lyase, chloroplastic [Spinacia oleracea]|uniref:Glyoxalase I n=1 Tax=Spinacia oleracea TaxID=3562 RepID=A0ABM3QZ73_SPIOL|nr:probable lactoylglutathione lyase, chloroplastic [Spinacia oleracea]